MAILTGFPPSNTISPSVRIAEKDLSFIAPEQSFHRAGLVGFASKGPINIPTRVSSTRQLHRVFGNPHPDVGDPYLIYAAEQYLLVANELYIVRVGDEDNVSDESAQKASVEVPSAGSRIVIQSDTAGPYSFPQDSFFRWRLNGVLSVKNLVVLADDNRESPDTGNAYSCEELAEALNDQLTDLDGIEFICNDDDKIAVRTTFAYGPDASLELVSVQDAIYGGGSSITGLGTDMTVAETTGDEDSYGDGYEAAGDWDFTGLEDDALDLKVVVDGTDNINIDNVVQVLDLSALVGDTRTTSEIVDEINTQIDDGNVPGGFEAVADGDFVSLLTLHHGRGARILVKSDSNGASIFGFSGTTAKGTSPEGVSGDVGIETYGIVTGDSNTTGEVTFVIEADSAGIEGNSTQVRIINNLRESSWTMEVFSNGVSVEAWGGLTKDVNSRFYVETFLSTVSDYIKVVDDTDILASPKDGTYDLSGGTDGIPSDPDDQDALLVGSDVGSTGIYALSEPEQIDIDLLAVPGHSSTTVIQALINVCQNMRQDCLAIIDAPFGLTVEEIVAWQNGTHPLNSARFDSDFAALYWPWVKIRDTYNRVDVWVPPSGSIMATIARSDFLDRPWFAPAGIRRGVVPGILDVFTRPTLQERDLMYGNRNAINPIIQFSDLDGFVVWGQKTLQRIPTALDRINVRRMLFIAEKRIRAASRTLQFDPHDEQLRQKFIDLSSAILREIQVERGLTAFLVQCDEELNSPDVIDRNELRARIGLQPTRAAEFIFIEFSVHRTGSFSETADTF